MIFFTDHIEPFEIGKQRINPIPCELKNGQKGYFLGNDKFDIIIDRVSAIMTISPDDIKTNSDD